MRFVMCRRPLWKAPRQRPRWQAFRPACSVDCISDLIERLRWRDVVLTALKTDGRQYTPLRIDGAEVVSQCHGFASEPLRLAILDVGAKHRGALHELLGALAEAIGSSKINLNALDQLSSAPGSHCATV